jgi:hypothetical protein
VAARGARAAAEAVRGIGVLTPFPADDAEGHARLTAFTQALQQSGEGATLDLRELFEQFQVETTG